MGSLPAKAELSQLSVNSPKSGPSCHPVQTTGLVCGSAFAAFPSEQELLGQSGERAEMSTAEL